MLARLSKLITATGMAAALTTGALPKPAAADTQSTLTTALGAAALIGGLILYNNYEHKRQAANSIVGYTRNGGTIYGDGRIVMPNGQTIYPNSNGQYPWGQTAYYRTNANGYAYDTQRTGRYDMTHRHGYAVNAAYRHPVIYNRSATYTHTTYNQATTYNHPTYNHATYNHATYNHAAYNHPAYNHAVYNHATTNAAVPGRGPVRDQHGHPAPQGDQDHHHHQ